MLPASLGSRKSADHKFLLEARLDLEPVGSPLAGPINTVFALGDDSLHPFFFGEIEQRLPFRFDIAAQLKSCGGFQNPFQDFSPLQNRFLCEVVSLIAEDVKNIIEGGGCWLFLEPLQKL